MPATAAPGRFIGHAIAASAVLCSAAAGQSITVVQPPQGGVGTAVHGISGDASTLVGATGFPYVSPFGTSYSATRWSREQGAATDVGAGWYRNTEFYASDFAGKTLVGSDGVDALRWTPDAGLMTLGRLAGGSLAAAHSASASGSVIVGWSDSSNGRRAVRWTMSGGVESIGALHGSSYSDATAVSADGSVIVGRSDSSLGGTRAFRWDANSGMQSLGVIQGKDYSYARGANADGSLIVGYSGDSLDTNTRAFRWTPAGGMQDLGTLAGYRSSFAITTNASGSIIAGWCEGVGTVDSFLWHDSVGMISLASHLSSQGLDLSGWSSFQIRSMSADGRYVVGTGRLNGEVRDFVADIGVIPAPGVALMFGFVGLSRSRRRA
jgi:probable HAF family extracellular repeat protein